MSAFNPFYVVLFGLLVIVAGVAFVWWQKRTPSVDPTWKNDPTGKLAEELARIRGQISALPVVLKPNASASTLPAAGDSTQPPSPPEIFVDRDDLNKWLGAVGFAFAVTLDGATIHGGFGPAVAYFTQPTGGVSRQQPGAQP